MNASVALDTLLGRHDAVATERALWMDGTLPLSLTTYLADDMPPLPLITSVRSLLFHNHTLMVLRNAHNTHILPGGRRKTDETLTATLDREILEECGWTIAESTLLGFIHFRHLAPKPVGYAYPYPDFFQLVCMSRANQHQPASRLADDYEAEAQFLPLDRATALTLTPSERAFLDAALALRAKS